MVGRGELTDAAWAVLAPLLPTNGRRGKQWRDHRQVVDGVLWRLRTGVPWRDVPERYGPWRTCYDRFARWRRDGTWDRLLARAHFSMPNTAVGEVVWEVSVDGTSIRVQRPGRRARRRPDLLLADKGYSYESLRRTLRARNIRHVIPQRTDQRARRNGRPGRRPLVVAAAYRRRNVVERCVARLKQFRALATRYEKRAANYRALVFLAALLLWLRP